jgi:hypothetical protein
VGEDVSGMREFEASIAICSGNAWVYYNRACVNDVLGTGRKHIGLSNCAAKEGPALNPFSENAARF